MQLSEGLLLTRGARDRQLANSPVVLGATPSSASTEPRAVQAQGPGTSVPTGTEVLPTIPSSVSVGHVEVETKAPKATVIHLVVGTNGPMWKRYPEHHKLNLRWLQTPSALR